VFHNVISRFDPWMKYVEDIEKLQTRVQNLEALTPYLKLSSEKLEELKKNKEKQNDEQNKKKAENDNQQSKEKEDDDDEDIDLFGSDSEASEQT
jgi:uncharacterized protein (DUF342 family)